MKLDEKLIYLRKKKGLTQLELAEAVNVSRQAVSKWESGGGMPSTENLLGLSELYGVPVDYLLNDEREPENGNASKDKTGNSPEPATEDSKEPQAKGKNRKKSFLVWVAIVLTLLILAGSFAFFFANKNKKTHSLGQIQGEEVETERNFQVGW